MFLEVGGRDAVCFGFRWEPGVLVYRSRIGVIRLVIVARVIGVFSLRFPMSIEGEHYDAILRFFLGDSKSNLLSERPSNPTESN